MGAELTKLINVERRKQSKELNLSSRNLTEIPPQIVVLKNNLER